MRQSANPEIVSIHRQRMFFFAKIRDTHRKFAEKSQVIVTH